MVNSKQANTDNHLTPTEKRFQLSGRNICAQLWQTGSSLDQTHLSEAPKPSQTNSQPLIFLHGWMDNCASFVPLLQALRQQRIDLPPILTIDLAGHGKSDHIAGLGAYNIVNDIVDIIAIADEMKWQTFCVVGHSRGAMISTLLAGAFPDRVTKLAVIDSIIPAYEKSENAPHVLAESVGSQLKIKRKKKSRYKTFEEAVKARKNGVVPVNYVDAETLAHRGVEKDSEGYFWNMAPLLMASSEIRLTKKQVQAFVDAIASSILLIAGDKGLVLPHQPLMQWVKEQKNIQFEVLPGGHHLHMSESAMQVAKLINNFFFD